MVGLGRTRAGAITLDAGRGKLQDPVVRDGFDEQCRHVFDRMDVTVEVHEEPTTPTVKIEKLKQWIKSHGRHPREEARKAELRKLIFGSR